MFLIPSNYAIMEVYSIVLTLINMKYTALYCPEILGLIQCRFFPINFPCKDELSKNGKYSQNGILFTQLISHVVSQL